VLRQALIDLVDNAIKYTPVGGRIRVLVSELPSVVTVDVIDSGPGIPPELRSRIFERYERGGQMPFGAIGGAGLGLSISRWAVEANGGKLTLEPDNGVGATFRITLPRATAARPQEKRQASVA
jgi:signal transduction histidine kinase